MLKHSMTLPKAESDSELIAKIPACKTKLSNASFAHDVKKFRSLSISTKR